MPTLLPSKLHVPATRPGRIARPHLIARLDAGLRGKLTLLAAPAGFGKTTLAAEWIAQAGRPFGWLSLDADDNDPVTFFRYLAAAIEPIGGCGRALHTLAGGEPPAIRAPALARALRPGAWLLASGIIADREAEAAEPLAAHGFITERRLQRGDWVTLLCHRASDGGVDAVRATESA